MCDSEGIEIVKGSEVELESKVEGKEVRDSR